jgi:hypothetical protein
VPARVIALAVSSFVVRLCAAATGASLTGFTVTVAVAVDWPIVGDIVERHLTMKIGRRLPRQAVPGEGALQAFRVP